MDQFGQSRLRQLSKYATAVEAHRSELKEMMTELSVLRAKVAEAERKAEPRRVVSNREAYAVESYRPAA